MGASQAGADHQRVARRRARPRGVGGARRRRARGAFRQGPRQALAFAPVTRAFVHGKARRQQIAAHLSGRAVGGDARARRREPSQGAKALAAPHRRVARWREAVQVPAIETQVAQPLQFVQGAPDIRPVQVEDDPAAVEQAPVYAFERGRKTGDQFRGQRRELRPARQGAAQLVAAQRVFVDTQIVQRHGLWSVFTPGRPGEQKIETGAEAEFADGVATAAASGQARRQRAAVDEHVPAFEEPVGGAEVRVPVAPRARLAGLAPLDFGALKRLQQALGANHAG